MRPDVRAAPSSSDQVPCPADALLCADAAAAAGLTGWLTRGEEEVHCFTTQCPAASAAAAGATASTGNLGAQWNSGSVVSLTLRRRKNVSNYH